MTDGGMTSGSATVPTTSFSTGAGDAGASSSAPDFGSIVPDSYKEELWVKDLSKADKPFEALFGQLKNAQSLIGKKSTGIEIPPDDATEEVRKAFFKALGVPETAEGYDYKVPDYSKEPEALRKLLDEEAKDDSFIKTMRAKALEAGLTPKQFKEMATAVDLWKIEQSKAVLAAAQAADVVREEKFKEIYGDKADQVKKVAMDVFKKVMPEKIAKTNDPDLALFEAMRFIHEKLYSNGSINLGGEGSSGDSKAELHAKIRELRKSPEYQNAMHPDHDRMAKRIREMYEELHSDS